MAAAAGDVVDALAGAVLAPIAQNHMLVADDMRKTRKRPILSTLVGVAIAVATGCSDIFGPGFDYAEIEVLVMDEAGAPAVGVPLTLYGKGRHYAYGSTDGSGRHVFEFVPFGGFGVAANAPAGYRFLDGTTTAHRYADVEEGERAHVEFVLEPVQVPAAETAEGAIGEGG